MFLEYNDVATYLILTYTTLMFAYLNVNKFKNGNSLDSCICFNKTKESSHYSKEMVLLNDLTYMIYLFKLDTNDLLLHM